MTDDTTEFIRRRIRHWKTSIVGIGSMVCPIIAILWPAESQKFMMLSAMLSGWGLTLAADGSRVPQSVVTTTPPPTGPPNPS